MQIEKKELPKNQLEFTVVAVKKELEHAEEGALKHLGEEVNVPGFRKGKAPVSAIRERVGEQRIFQEKLDHLLHRAYHEVLESEGIFPILPPEVSLENEESLFEKDTPSLTIKIKITLRPSVKLPDYKKLNVKMEKPEMKDTDVDKAVEELFERWKKNNEEENSKVETATSLKEAEVKAKESSPKDQQKNTHILKEKPDDEWAQTLGAANLAKLREMLAKNMELEQTYAAERKFVQDIFDELTETSAVEIPDDIVTSEVETKEKQTTEQLEKLGLDLDSYAKQQKLTVEKLRGEWKKQAQTEVALEFILADIGDEEKINVSEEEVKREIEASKDSQALKVLQDPDRRRNLQYLMRRDKIVRKLVEWNKPTQKKPQEKSSKGNTKKSTQKGK